MENVIIKFTADTDGLQPAIKQLELIGKITAEDAARIEKLNAEQREYIQTVNQTSTAFGELSAEAKDLTATISAQVLQGVSDAMAEMGKEAQQGATKFKSLKAELRELKAQIAKGDMGAKELREATKRAAELEDKIGDVSEKVRALASDTKYIDSAVTAMRGLAAAGAVTQGAMALLGGENQKVQESLMKVQAATAVLMGVQEMATIVTGQSAAKTLFLDGAQKLAAVSSKALGVTITTSMAAATMGLSLVIGAIAALVLSMDDANKDVKKIQEEARDRAKKDSDFMLEIEEMRIRRMTDAKERELAEANHQNKKLIRASLQRLKDGEVTQEQHNLYMEELQANHSMRINEIAEKYRQQDLKNQAKYNKDKQDGFIKQMLAELKAMKDYEESQKWVNEAIAREERRIQLERDNEYLESVTEKFERQRQIKEEAIVADKEINERAAADMDALLDKQFEKMIANINAEKDARKSAVEASVLMAQTMVATFQELNNRRLQSELDTLNAMKDAEIRNADLTEAQRQKIEERYRRQEARLKAEAFKQQKTADIIQATINTALAVSRALATPPSPNIAASVAAGVAGAAQVALIASQPVPKFAKGTEMFKTDGTGTSDSGLAWLSHGERVVPASINSEYWTALSAIHNRKISPRLANEVIEELSHGRARDGVGFDYDRLGRVIGGGKSGSKVVINLDEKGFTKHVLRENSRTTYLNKKLRLNA